MTILSNKPDGLSREFGVRAGLSVVGGAVLDHVVSVRLPRVPAKILKPVIGAVAVVVAAFHAGGSRPDKCFKHKRVYLGGSRDTVSVEVDAPIAIAGDSSVLFSRTHRPHAPLVADFVKTFKAHDGLPVLDSKRKLILSHDRSSRTRVVRAAFSASTLAQPAYFTGCLV